MFRYYMQISLTSLCVQYGGLQRQVSDYRKYHYYQLCRDNVENMVEPERPHITI
jgi:hypothetical protein